MQLHRNPLGTESPSGRAVAAGQVLLNAGLLLIAVAWAIGGHRRALVIAALVPLVFVPFSYARVRLQDHLARHLGAPWIWLVAAAGLGLDAIMAAQLITARSTPPAWLTGHFVQWIGAVWFSAHALLLLGYAVAALARLAGKPLGRLRPSSAPRADADTALLGRRELLQKAALAGVAVPFGVSLSSTKLSYDFRVEERVIVVPNWPRQLDDLRVVHLSDIHVGGAMDRARLMRVAELTNRCQPDLVLHTGDFLTHRQGNFDEPLYQALATVRAPLGQWACLGNHDYDNLPRLLARMGQAGVTVLQDRLARLAVAGETLEIGGLDYVFARLQRQQIFAEVVRAWGEHQGARLLLSHDPSTFGSLPQGGGDLVLAGHTHGGHVGIQLDQQRAITVVGLAGLADQGLFERPDMRMYVTRCVGFYGYPMRIGIPPEIALLRLRSA